jgi:hypothetical protein
MKTVLFFRRIKGLTGGHLKVWDFFRHTLASGDHTARVVFSSDSVWTQENPWRDAREFVVRSREDVKPDLFFLDALDWDHLTPMECVRSKIPIINLIAGVSHANAGDPRRALLGNRAIRICVSREVADAIHAAGPPNGPVVIIPNAVNVADAPPAAARDIDLLIVAGKQPGLGKTIAARLGAPGRRLELLEFRVPRPEFLSLLGRAKTALFLPRSAEGFYLPALEGMAMGALVVCPDAVGNREFCEDGVNCLMPQYGEDAIVAAAESALAMPPAAREAMHAAARATVERHGLDEERTKFVDLLRRAPELWKS